MKKYILFLFFAVMQLFCFAQSEKAKTLVDEGIELHDNGKYEAALKKYDAAIAESPDYIDALYEKTLTFYAMGKLTECIDLSKQMLKQFPGDAVLKNVYVQYGSALDDLGKPADAIKIYNEGLKKFPGYYLIQFNKGITYSMMNEQEKAYTSYQDALTDNPSHASSYYRVGELLKSSNHIPAMLASIMHLLLEPNSDRSKTSFKNLKELIYSNVEKTGDNTISITMSADMLDTKKSKKQPDNFRMQEMLFTMSSALDKDSVMNSKTKTDIEKFDLKLQLLINSLSDGQKGFFSERYVPFFKSLKEKGFTMMVSRVVFANTNDETNAAWLKTHAEQIADFYEWLEDYTWPAK